MKLAKDLLTNKISPLTEQHTVGEALALFHSQRLLQLPFVVENIFKGMIVRTTLEQGFDENATLEQLATPQLCIDEMMHPFAMLDRFISCQCESIAVTDMHQKYLGIVTASALLQELSVIMNSMSEGTLLELSIHPKNYSISQIAHIAEQENTPIISLNSYIREDQKNMFLLLRVDREDATAFIQSLNRFDYNVTAIYHRNNLNNETMQKRVDELIHYLEI